MGELRVGILTCSNAVAEGGDDPAGTWLMEACEDRGWFVVDYYVCADDREAIGCSLLELCDAEQADVVFTLGGTGLSPHEITPDATEAVSERMVPGVAEAIRDCGAEDRADHVLSRATAGIRGSTLIINMPGSAERTAEAFEAVADYLPTASEAMSGVRPSEIR